jgi:DNA adenine methylase
MRPTWQSEDGALKAPFPWFGGKSRAAGLVWSRFGAVDNYVEPFAGSLAVLLGNPASKPPTETVNDVDAYLVNFWRALQADPDGVAHHADCPVFECDLHARHAWLHGQAERVERIKSDPEWYDVRVAGYWAWGLSSWIGDNFCRPKPQQSVPHLGDPGKGVNRQLPHLGNPGKGVNRQLPHLRNPGMGVNRQLPHLGDPGKGVCAYRRAQLVAYFEALADRLRFVRVCCGDWARVLTPSVTFRHGLTAVFLDPPYEDHGGDDVYGAAHGRGVAPAVREWCLANGSNRDMRIALCGYGDEHAKLEAAGWSVCAWKANGGYANLSGKDNRHRERIWFSPACIADAQPMLLPPEPQRPEQPDLIAPASLASPG